MHRIRIAVQLSLVLAVAFSAVAFCIPTDAKAACWYPKRVTYTYYGYWVDNEPRCDHPPVSPPIWPVEVVGEKVIECDGTVNQWGIECSNYTIARESCAPVCD